MVLGDFSFSFLISVVTWWIYNSVLFSVAEQMQMGDGSKKRIGKMILFGFLATLIKAGIDTCIDRFLRLKILLPFLQQFIR